MTTPPLVTTTNLPIFIHGPLLYLALFLFAVRVTPIFLLSLVWSRLVDHVPFSLLLLLRLIQPNKHRTVSLFTLFFLVETGRMSHIFHESVEQSLLSMISFYILCIQQTFLLVRCIIDLFSVKVRNLLRSYDPFVGVCVCVCVCREGKNSYTDLDSCFRLLPVFRVNDEMTE